jgi:hypothetical protein
MSGLLHQKVGPDYVNIVVIPEIEQVLRVLIGRLNAEELYKTEGAILEKSISGAIEQISRRYVRVDDVIIKKLKLPFVIEQAIQLKITQKHRAAAYEFKIEREKKEKERKRIEAEGLKIFDKALSPEILRWMGIDATLKLSKSKNSKIVIFGGGKDGGLPIIGNIPLSPHSLEVPESSEDTRPSRSQGETETSASPSNTEPSTSRSVKALETPDKTNALEAHDEAGNARIKNNGK